MNAFEIEHLNKKYAKFELKDVSFQMEYGYIMGFIGKNGAGKTTTMKSMLHLVHPDSGKITIGGLDINKDELELRQKVGAVFGGVDFYPNNKLKVITDVVKKFYKEWDQAKYEELMELFELDESKKVKELSAGMKVKYNVALQMSHNAKLLILDEPTSGLDPAARDDLILLFQKYIEDGEHSIIFSTHITSDLDKCADYITYIKQGQILASTDKESFKESYRQVAGKKEDLTEERRAKLIGLHEHSLGFEGMIATVDEDLFKGCEISPSSLEDIMVHFERKF